MRLSEIVGAATGLAVYAEVGLVLFLLAFIAVLVQVVWKANQDEFQRAESLPLDDGATASVVTEVDES